MSKTIWNPGALLAPVPAVLVTCGTMETPNILTVAWTGIAATRPATTYVSIRPQRFSYGLIERTGEFALNLPSAELVKALDFCGVRSGRDVNKWEACKLTPQAASKIGAPLVEECPVSIECRVRQKIALGSHDMFLAEILAVQVREELLDKQGKLCLERANLLAYSHGVYYTLGKPVGTFGFSVRKKKAGKTPAKKKKGAR